MYFQPNDRLVLGPRGGRVFDGCSHIFSEGIIEQAANCAVDRHATRPRSSMVSRKRNEFGKTD